MKLGYCFLSTLTLFIMYFGSVNGNTAVSKTVIVDPSGHGDFKSVQEAVNSVADNNKDWIKIHVTKGIYNEKVVVPSSKTHIVLEGDGAENTVIQWGDHVQKTLFNRKIIGLKQTTTRDSATMTILSSNFVAQDISFKNDFDEMDLVHQSQAVAVLLDGDKMSFYRCGFIGFQDTLYDSHGRHYFKDCLIKGSVDFIFGYGQSIYEDCHLVTVGKKSDLPGSITAHGRAKLDDTTGYVFKSCSISGTRKTYLGRAWGPFSRVLFYGTTMTDVVVPEGWQAWKAIAKPDQTSYAETQCSGPGSNTSGRVQWEKNLSNQEWSTFINDDFIDAEGWRSQQP